MERAEEENWELMMEVVERVVMPLLEDVVGANAEMADAPKRL